MSKEKGYEYTSYNSGNIDLAKALRKSMTKQEKHLWYDFLQKYPVKFYKQRPLDNYIVDFYCSKAKLVIELDGSQHYSEEGILSDSKRTAVLNQLGIEVLRFSNSDVNENFEGVCLAIDKIISEKLNIPMQVF